MKLAVGMLSLSAAALLLPAADAEAATYRLAPQTNFQVTRWSAPFSPATPVEGFFTVPDDAVPDGAFFGHPTLPLFPGAHPVLDFRFTAAGFEWHPGTGGYSFLGEIGPDGQLLSFLIGLERSRCASLAPCFLDMTSDGAWALRIYQPGTAPGGFSVGYQLSAIAPGGGAALFPLSPGGAAPEPGALLLAAIGLLALGAARISRA